MNTRKGVIVIVFARKLQETQFLLLHRSFVWSGWEFPKSSLKTNESEETALARIIKDSTGLKRYAVVNKLPHKRQFVHRNIHHIYSIYTVEAEMDDPVLLSDITEHDGYSWEPTELAKEKLYFDNEKREVVGFGKEL